MRTFLAGSKRAVVTKRRTWVDRLAPSAGLARLREAIGLVRGVRALLDPPVRAGEIPVPDLGGEVLAPGAPFRILSWNVQYCAGRGRRFFYDGGPDVAVTGPEVEATLSGIAALIRGWNPDVVLLQEVDRGADRTGRTDQHRALAERLALPVALSSPYHRVRYVPHPPGAHLGRVDLHLSVFSRYQLLRAARHHLPLIRESWARQRFNLRRILLEADVATTTGAPLRLFQTHLSAFSFGDGSLAEQVRRCADAVAEVERAHGRWILAGDLNALPPGDDASRLGADAALYPEADPPILALTDRFATPGMPPDPAGRSWIPWGSNQPDRQLDWIFHGRRVARRDHRVDPAGGAWSDHLPLITDLALA